MAIDSIRRIVTGTTVTSLLAGMFSLFSGGLMFVYDASLALVGVGLTLVALVATAMAGYVQLRYQRELARLQGQLAGLVLQLMTGISKLRVAGAEDRAFAHWARQFAEQKQRSFQAGLAVGAFSVFGSVWPMVATLIIFAAVAATTGPHLATGAFLGFLVAFGQFLGATLLFGTAATALLQCLPLYERVRPIFQARPEVTADKLDPGVLGGAIELGHVTFSYGPDAPPVLHDATLRIAPGEFVAIVGPSGAGKSTLLRLLLGFETAQSGAIYFDGRDLASLDLAAVRQQMGVVTQDSKVTPGTVYSNIAGSSTRSIDDAWAAATTAGIDADIREMPMGMFTQINEGGLSFSGGQLQRLMIARAIIGRPRILLFDEATSALDNVTQAIVSRSLEGLQATRVVIAHRLTTIQKADRIYVLVAGTVVQSGTYAELVNAPGPFAQLAARQLV
jgi:ATP-binding cassette subfamily C protein